ncbi:sugar ABC transporter substrate-binding protein [Pseudoalteromonas sp. T1lg65]|uniref:sugar ABC transporter substrate-binding protein n=1 Tax=Pseudoalteromonas sp. T1lg65 TaxID=2077101 RepID=UPI003F7A5E32
MNKFIFGFITMLFFNPMVPVKASQLDPSKTIDIAVGLENFDFQRLFDQFSEETGITVNILAFNNNQLKSELLLYADARQLPDAVLIPSDYMGLTELNFSTIPEQWLNPDLTDVVKQSIQVSNDIKGVPVIYGNHLLLYYNRKLVSEPITDLYQYLQQSQHQPSSLGWNYYEMYWFSSLVGAFQDRLFDAGVAQLNTLEMEQALSAYQIIYNSKKVDHDCNYQCSMARFREGKLPYLVNGIWAYSTLQQVMSDSLGVAPLPTWQGNQLRSYSSTHVLGFPAQSLQAEKRPLLKKLAIFIQSAHVQDAMWTQLNALPTTKSSLTKLSKHGDKNLQQIILALSHTRALPNEPIMAYIWEAMLKGMTRFTGGAYSAKQTANYMQFIVTKSMQNEKKSKHR